MPQDIILQALGINRERVIGSDTLSAEEMVHGLEGGKVLSC